tara:strand:- start:1235 stop:1687 length:453 start_codon:yes stop_codon:yes gene_type:complete
MTKEEWDLKQNSLKKSYKYVPTGVPGQVKKIEDTQEEETEDDNGRKKKKQKEVESQENNSVSAPPKNKIEKELSKKRVKTPQGKYSAVVDRNGRTIKNPTELEAIRANLDYMKTNMSDQSSNPSNVYRPENEHKAINYNKKKMESKMNKA